MANNRIAATLKASGIIETHRHALQRLQGALTACPLWSPGVALQRQCAEAGQMIDKLVARLERKLVVTLIGPTGSGKSTLLNALAGVDDLSVTGHRRPTTRQAVVFCGARDDADQLVAQLGAEAVSVVTSQAAQALTQSILIDTPDMDSTEQEAHIPIIRKALGLSDILICVFNAENPKRRDHVDFLAPYVRMFQGEAVICVINRCDRLAEAELREVIVPEFSDFIRSAWQRPVEKIFCISARRHLQDPDWDPGAPPRHDFDQYPKLHAMIFGAFNRPGFVVDQRLQNAAALRDYIETEIRGEIQKDRPALEEALKKMAAAEKDGVGAALTSLYRETPGQLLGVNVRLYQLLAHRWTGPVGWLVALWARVLVFGTGVAAMLRLGNPLRQLWGAVATVSHYRKARSAVADSEAGKGLDQALLGYRLSLLKRWPEIAELLVRGRFAPEARDVAGVLPEPEELASELGALWNGALERALEKAAKKLSGVFIQVLFNLPILALLCHVGWITASNYFSGHYLSGDFFLHAFVTLLIALLLAFFVFQVITRATASPERLAQGAFEGLQQQATDFMPLGDTALARQVRAVLVLDSAPAAAAEDGPAEVGSAHR
ncbi:MAG: 50S ribosome-binding GTPase [Desulfobacteraceae bacterium]|nr:50S ribosome-binding GTPase [Desulfobacteraceae bacterium]